VGFGLVKVSVRFGGLKQNTSLGRTLPPRADGAPNVTFGSLPAGGGGS